MNYFRKRIDEEVHSVLKKLRISMDNRDCSMNNVKRKIDVEKALRLKQTGNSYYQKGDFAAAIDSYSAAIEENPYEASFFTNRALIYKKLEKYNHSVADCDKALSLSDKCFKARFYKGSCLSKLGKYDNALSELHKALSLAPDKHTRAYVELEIGLIKSEESKVKIAEELSDLCCVMNDIELDDEKSIQTLRRLVEDRKEKLQHQEVPLHLCCQISMTLMKDPVITPSGITYERGNIEEHISRNGDFEPTTRSKCTMEDLRSNLAIREAIEVFLDNNPWGYDEYI